jgi:RNA polymerase sigma-70 factor (ECF subfamily)
MKVTKEQLGTLILHSERQLYSTAKTFLMNDQDCADAIQETIVKAFSKIETLKNDKYAKTWLIRILINECYTLLRKSSKIVSLEEISEITEIEADRETNYSDLYKAVNSLKEELRVPVVLYYIEDFHI